MFDSALLELAQRALEKARAQRLRIAAAESCTGGLVAAILTEIAGASDVFERGFVVYSNDAKTELLGVPEHAIAAHGAVSEAVASAMAEGAIKYANAQLSVAVTGIAGPGGGTAEKPVGLVHIAAAREGRETLHERHLFGDIGRTEIRLASVEAALRLLLAGLILRQAQDEG
jgi:nicotinamide-nucleotide amidase